MERGLMLREYEAYHLKRLNDELAQLNLDGIRDPAEMERVIRKVPLLRFQREKSLQMLQEPVIHRERENKTAESYILFYRWIGIPLIIGAGIHTWIKEKEHFEHFDETFADYIPYPYLRVRNTKMPFGDDQTLFFNPRRNYDPRIHGPRPLRKETSEQETN